MKRIINCETGEIIERELNAEELAQQEIDEAKYLELKALDNERDAQRQALLSRLGITEEEARILLG